MISLIQTFTQKNHKILFGSLLVIIIIAFVGTIGNNLPSCGAQGSYKAYKNTFYGYDLNNQKVTNALFQASAISVQLQGRRIYNQDMERMLMLTRAVSLHLADELNIPLPLPENVAEYLQGLAAFKGNDGKFSQEALDNFIKTLNGEKSQISEARFWDIVQEDWRIMKLQTALRGPGYATPYAAEQELRMRNTRWSVDVAAFDYGKFKNEITVSDTDLATYYEQNKFRYEIPQRAKVSYVFFPLERFADKVGDIKNEETLQVYYLSNRGLFPEKKTFEEARTDVVIEYKKSLARREALRFANDDFVLKLYRDEIARTSPMFQDILKSMNATLIPVEPFARSGLPEHPVLPRNLLEQAFTIPNYYSEPHPVKDGVAVILLDEMIPAQLQPLEFVREQAIADFKESKRRDAFTAKGAEFKKQLAEQTKKAEDFPLVSAKMGLSIQPYRDFSMMNPPEGLDQVVLSALNSASIGSVSDMINQSDIGYFVYVVKKELPSTATSSKETEQLLKRIESASAQQSAADLLQEMIAIGLAQAQGDKK